ncbi:MAG: hypothetical protein WAN75_01935 [Xanthobacteraceae bacterium]
MGPPPQRCGSFLTAILAADVGLEIRQNGISPFKLWDGVAFVPVKPEAGTAFHGDR